MLEKVFHWLSGYAEFEVSGDTVRFINICTKRGFDFWGFSHRGDKAVLCCKPGEYRRLRPMIKRCQVRTHCTEKHGLPFHIARLHRRKGIIFGIVGAAALYFFLSGFVWNITITGSERLTDRQVLQAAAACGVYIGAPVDGFESKMADRQMIAQLPRLKWVSVNTDGCFIELVIGEREEKPQVEDKEAFSNIVASRAGIVREIQAMTGRPEISVGDTVQAGDLLISGLYQEEPDPWGPVPDEIYQVTGAARGSVIAETDREFTVQVSERVAEVVPTQRRKELTTLNLLSLKLPLGFWSDPQEPCEIYTTCKSFYALGCELPVSVEKRVYVYTEEITRVLTEDELRMAALFKLRETQKAAMTSGKVVREDLNFTFADGMCILKAKCRCEEEIGEYREILVN